MKLKNMKKDELEILSYTDLTEMILKENKKPMNTASIFKYICKLLELSDEEYADKIGDYYTSLTTDKRFVLLSTAEWDLRDNHKIEISLDEDDDEEVLEEEGPLENDEDVSESIEITDDEVDLDEDDDMDDLSIVDDTDLNEEEI